MGSYGEKIKSMKHNEIINKYIPRYSQSENEKFPDWKVRYIKQNRDFYKKKQRIFRFI